MKYVCSLVIFILFIISFNAYSQIKISEQKTVTEQGSVPKSYPIAGSDLMQDHYKEVAEYIKANPDYYQKMRLDKTTAWNFTVGSPRNWWSDNEANLTRVSTPCTCRDVGKHCYIFVEDASWNKYVNQTAVDAVMNEFDNQTPADSNMGVYDTDVNTFGNPPDVDHDPKIIIVIMDIQDGYSASSGGGWIAGYFDSYNETNQSESNNAEIYFMDDNPTNLESPDGLETALETCAHEFQHMINWNYHQTNPEATFINEGLSMFAEVNCGFPTSFQSLYANETNIYLLTWRGSNNTLVLNDYGRAQRFFMYWSSQYGTGVFKNIVQDNQTGLNGLIHVLSSVDPNLSFSNFFTNFEIANKLDDRSVDTHWGYIYSGLPKATAKTFANPNASSTDAINDLGAEYLTFDNGSNLNINFSSTTTSNNIVIKAIETGSSGSRVVDAPLNTQFSEPLFGSQYSAINFAIIDTSQFYNQSVSYTSTGTINSNVTEIKWDTTEPVGYIPLIPGDSVAVEFDGVNGATLDSIRVALRGTAAINGNILSYIGTVSQMGGNNIVSFTATPTISQAPPVVNPNGDYPYPIPYPNWVKVDLTAYNINAGNSFVVEFPIGATYPASNRVMCAYYISADPYHSYAFDNSGDTGVWTYYGVADQPGYIFLFLIRAYVSVGAAGVKQEIELTPRVFSLSQNYPNPFNPSTVISWQLAVGNFVTLKVYDILGRMVKTLVNEQEAGGTHSITFNTAGLPSGIYYYRIEAGSFTQTRKMVLLK